MKPLTLKYFRYSFIVFMALLTNACNKADFNFDKLAKNQWDPEFALPIVNSTVSVSDINLAASSYLQINPDKTVSIVYQGNLAKLYASDFISQINSAPSSFSFGLTPVQTVTFAAIPPGSTYIASSSHTIDIVTQTSGNSMDVDSLYLKAGKLTIQVQNSFSHNITIDLTIPTAKKTGVPLSTTLTINANSTITTNLDLTGYFIDLTRSGTTQNKLDVQYTISFSKNTSGATGNINFTSSITNASFRLVYGNAKQQGILNKSLDSIPLAIFKTAQGIGNITLNDALLKLSVSNSFGIPFQVSLNSIKGFNPQKGTFFLNTAGITPNPFVVVAPSVPGQTALSVLMLNKDNPTASGSNLNLPSFLGNLPYSFSMQVGTQTNPSGVVLPSYKNYIADTSSASIDALITIPLDGKLNGFAVKDTFDFSFGSVDNVESIALRTFFKNGFPLDLTATFIFTDPSYNTIYTLDGTTHPILNAGAVDGTGKIITKTSTLSDFTIGSAVIPNLSKVKKVIMQLGVSSTGNGSQNVKIYSDYTLDIMMGIKAKLKV